MRALAVERGDAAKDIGFGGRPDKGFVAQQRGIGGGQRRGVAKADAGRIGQRRVDLQRVLIILGIHDRPARRVIGAKIERHRDAVGAEHRGRAELSARQQEGEARDRHHRHDRRPKGTPRPRRFLRRRVAPRRTGGQVEFGLHARIKFHRRARADSRERVPIRLIRANANKMLQCVQAVPQRHGRACETGPGKAHRRALATC